MRKKKKVRKNRVVVFKKHKQEQEVARLYAKEIKPYRGRG